MDRYVKEIKKLIEDEIEAVEGYDHSSLLFDDYPEIQEEFKQIKKEELDHIKRLKELIKIVEKDEFDLGEEE